MFKKLVVGLGKSETIALAFFEKFSIKVFVQPIFGKFRPDFYLPELNLIVEIDGKGHKYVKEKDKIRDEFFKSIKIDVARVREENFIKDLYNILESRDYQLPKVKVEAIKLQRDL